MNLNLFLSHINVQYYSTVSRFWVETTVSIYQIKQHQLLLEALQISLHLCHSSRLSVFGYLCIPLWLWIFVNSINSELVFANQYIIFVSPFVFFLCVFAHLMGFPVTVIMLGKWTTIVTKKGEILAIVTWFYDINYAHANVRKPWIETTAFCQSALWRVQFCIMTKLYNEVFDILFQGTNHNKLKCKFICLKSVYSIRLNFGFLLKT